MTIRRIEFDASSKILSSSLILSPISAVKELIENAIDSGAKNIYIDIDEMTGGCEYIRVRDDGSGIELACRKLMCLNHATSKVSSLQEIKQTSTLGFRGQALFLLASLCNAMGSMEISTKCKGDIVGEKWFVNGDGSIKDSNAIRIPSLHGTTLVLRRLLAGLRARYLMNSAKSFKEIRKIKLLIDHYSLEYRSIRFHFHLVRLDKNGLIIKRELQQCHDTKFTRVRILSSIGRLRGISGNNFIEEGISIDKFSKMNVILPRTLPHNTENFVNVKTPKKFLSFNGRPLSLEINFGESINNMIDSIYHELRLLNPMIWYLDLRTDMKIADVNIEPEKNDVLIKDVDLLLNKMKQILITYLVRELNLKHEVLEDSSLAAEDHTQENSHSQSSRPLTSGSMVSNEGEWTHTLLDDDDDGDLNSIEGGVDDLPSSLTYNYRDSSSQDEDLEISKELSISNPFMTAKLRRAFKNNSHKFQNELSQSLPIKRSPSQPNSGENLIDGHRQTDKIFKLDKEGAGKFEEFEFGNTLEDTTLVSVQEDIDDDYVEPKRSIFNFCELTNNYITKGTFEIPHYSLSTYSQELNWLSRKGLPSEWLIAHIKSNGNVYSSKASRNFGFAEHAKGFD